MIKAQTRAPGRSNSARSARPARLEEHPGSTATAAQPAAARRDLLDDVWRLFSSPKLALVLILAITAACFVGALVIQAPPEVLKSPEGTRSWIERAARPKLGAFTDPFFAVGLLWIFSTPWFRGLLALLAINIVVCTINRLPSIWNATFRPVVRPKDGLFERGEPRQVVFLRGASSSEATAAVRQTLKQSSFRAVQADESGGTYLLGDRFRLSRFGTLLTHGALILVLAGAVLQQPLGFFEEPGFAVPVGSTREVGHETGLAVQVEDFADEYLPDGRPKDYRSDVVLFDGGQEVARQTVRVNDPLIYNGVRFHQAYYGQSALLSVVEPDKSAPLYRDAVALTWRSNDGQRPVGYFFLPTRDLHVYLVGTAGEGDSVVRPGEVLLEAYQGLANKPTYRVTLTQRQPLRFADLDFTFEREIPFTGLRVVRDPGGIIVWIASTLLVLGMAITFYFPARRLWVRVRPEPAGAQVTLVGAGRETGSYVQRLAEQLSQPALAGRARVAMLATVGAAHGR